MKKIFLLTAMAFCSIAAFSQSKMACCAKPSATKQFAMLASDKKFVMSHATPKPYHFQSSIGKAITYKTSDGKTANAFEIKAKKPTDNWLLVVHEWWGLNDFVKHESEKLYNDLGDVNVLDLDLYDGKVATTREDAGKFMQAVKDDRAETIIKGAIAYVGPKAHIATIGWCFGGGWSLQTSLMAGSQDVACVMYYGMPEQDVNKLKTLHADVLGNFANKDGWINPKVVAKFAENMKAAGKKLELHQYNADHGFANPSNPIYDSEATKDAYAKTLAFLKPRLK
ncbi:dienelactone hydrolase family protein [Mucilaginibacter ginsenosidivorans]|uniref:Dienelactone hydrolase family protein n=1 Tax=Mucilaginibacter ginsenosidivorans TaxID=398053 RepID=A0A5B8UTQ5_9SPHI|nr:dienelactone hydrolase family protein [Mucilaginibacter ginsenosidivorans]QEC61781.1 dienelactone hydrolase family protein [Mucilaginibacter ginsenosidivorans]